MLPSDLLHAIRKGTEEESTRRAYYFRAWLRFLPLCLRERGGYTAAALAPLSVLAAAAGTTFLPLLPPAI